MLSDCANAGTVQDLADLLRRLRRRNARRLRAAELTYRELAAQTGWSHAAIGEYLSGRTLPPVDRLDELARLLGATPAELGALATARDRAADLHRAGTSAQPGNGAGTPVPGQLPAPVRLFAGRSKELQALDAMIDDEADEATPLTVAIWGPPGVGKTTLALRWAHRVADRFPDGQLFVNLRGYHPDHRAVTTAEAVLGFLEALAVRPEQVPASVDAQVALYRSLLVGRRILVVLDNAATAEQARPLLPGAPTCRTVVTSRNELTGLVSVDAARPLTLDMLSPEESRTLLAARLGAARVEAEADAAAALVQASARLPLALAIVAARAASQPDWPLRALVGQIRAATSALDPFADADPAGDLRAVFSWSYRQLSPAAGRLFRLLGLHRGPGIAAPACASLAGVPVGEVRLLLAELTRASLLVEHAPGRYAFHDLLHSYAAELAERLDVEIERRQAVHRTLDHYLHTAYTAARVLEPGRAELPLVGPVAGTAPESPRTDQEALAWFEREREVLLALVRICLDDGWNEHAWQLAWALGWVLMRSGHWHDGLAVEQAALTAGERLQDITVQARAHRAVMALYIRLGRQAEGLAHAERGLDLARRSGDVLGQAAVHYNLASMLGEQPDRLATALDHARQALELCRAAANESRTAYALDLVSWLSANAGDLEPAAAACRQALAIHQRIGDRLGQLQSWYNLGFTYHRAGAHRRAVACYGRSLRLCRDLGDRYGETMVLSELGDTYQALGEPDRARQVWQQALSILDELGHADARRVQAKLDDLRHPPPAPTTPDPTGTATAGAATLVAEGGNHTATPLTPRETEVARLVAEGLTNRQVARQLEISEWTAVNHMRQIMRKLGHSSRTQVAQWWWVRSGQTNAEGTR